MQITLLPDSTYVLLIATHKQENKNKIERIHCEYGSPIGGYVYDHIRDSYLISCYDYVPIGAISLSCSISIGASVIHLPLPDSVVERYLSDRQKQEVNMFKHDHADCKFEFIQMTM
jgi:hypothetical protein